MRFHPFVASVALVAPLVLLAAACGETGTAGSGPEHDPLVGRTFLGDAITVDGEEVTVAGGGRLEVSFRSGDEPGITTLSARAGCNLLAAGYLVDDGRIVTDAVGGTEMGCDPEHHEFDELVAELLDSPRFELDGADLVLSVDGVDRRLEARLTDAEVADPAPPLEGTEWSLDSFVEGETVSSVPGSVPVTMTLLDGRVAVDTGCNSVEGTYELTGTAVVVEVSSTTDASCGPEVAEVESRLAEVLDGELTVEQDRRSLTLLRADGTGLGFVAP